MSAHLDLDGIQNEAMMELQDEVASTARGKIKQKLREIRKAQKVVQNLEMELELLKDDLQIEFDGIAVSAPQMLNEG